MAIIMITHWTAGVKAVTKGLGQNTRRATEFTSGRVSRLVRYKGSAAQASQATKSEDELFAEFRKTIPAFNFTTYNTFMEKYSRTLTEDSDSKMRELEAKLGPEAVKRLKGIARYLNTLSSLEDEYLFKHHDELLCVKHNLHPIALQQDPRAPPVKVSETEFCHPVNYFLQQEGMAKLWANKQGLSLGGGGGAASGAAAAAEAKAAQKKAAEAAPVVEEKKNFDVVLKGYAAADKVKIIKELKTILNLGLKEAKDKVDAVPCKLMENKPKAEAEALVEKLKAVGCQIELA